MSLQWLEPDWPAPPTVRALSTLRRGGVSEGEFASLNLGDHVGDQIDRVIRNRQLLVDSFGLPGEPIWLRQVHGASVLDAFAAESLVADGSWTDQIGLPCVVMTADCLPVLLCDEAGTRIAAVHAGWRGLAAGVVESAVHALGEGQWMAWLGPAIGPDAFEVGGEVRDAFLNRLTEAEGAFRQGNEGRWYADIYVLAELVLRRCGVDRIYGGGYCTMTEVDRFFSYRRDGRTGRMATLIWLR